MNSLHAIAIWVAYLTLLVELVFLHVPSMASTLQILFADADIVAAYSARYQALFRYPYALKLLLFVVPIGIIYVMFAFPLAVTVVGADPLGDYVFESTGAWAAAGVVILITGRIVTLWATAMIRIDNRQRDGSFFLHTKGPFRRSRNPGLVGMYLFLAGIWLIMPSLALAAGILLYVAYMDFKVRMEEDFLANKFGEPYASYCKRTGRYLS